MIKPTPNSQHMSSKSATLLILALLLTAFIGAVAVYAQGAGGTNNQDSEAAMWINYVLCKIANLIFLIVGALAALVIILAGLKWLTSGDDPGARNAAKTAIVSAFVGIIIIFIAVFVVWWVVSGLLPEKAQGVNPTIWVSGDCESLKAASNAAGTESGKTTGGGETVKPSGTCDAACGGKNTYLCLADCGEWPDKGLGKSDCNTNEKCCCYPG